MLSFECRNLGTQCKYIAQGNTLEEVKRNAMAHTQTVHKYWFLTRSPQQKTEIDETFTKMIHSP